MKKAIIKFNNGSVIETSINGTNKEIREYYINKYFNLGSGENDLMAQAVSVEVYDV